MPATYFLGSRVIATSPHPLWWSDSDKGDNSLVFICPICGDAWGRVAVTSCPWLPLVRGCPKHPDYPNEPGGSFIAPWRKQFAELPPEVLAYELSIRLNLYKEDSE